jgi:predicted metal-binding protein
MTWNAWLKLGELFPETDGSVIATQDQVISTVLVAYLEGSEHSNDICGKCRQKSEISQHNQQSPSSIKKLLSNVGHQRENRHSIISIRHNRC